MIYISIFNEFAFQPYIKIKYLQFEQTWNNVCYSVYDLNFFHE